jgi:hypothetical protein
MNDTYQELVFPIPLHTRALPASVLVRGLLTPEHCTRLVELAEKKGMEPIVKSRHDQETFTAAGCWISPEDDRPVFESVAERCVEINADNWRIGLSGIYSQFSILRYGSGNWIRPHTDADYRLADATKLTCIVQLVARDAFKGGRLTLAENETYDLDIGDGVIFPAQTIHTVSALEEGRRYVLAAWVQGPNFV